MNQTFYSIVSITAVFLLSPLLTQAQTSADLQNMIDQLMQQVEVAQAAEQVPTVPTEEETNNQELQEKIDELLKQVAEQQKPPIPFTEVQTNEQKLQAQIDQLMKQVNDLQIQAQIEALEKQVQEQQPSLPVQKEVTVPSKEEHQSMIDDLLRQVQSSQPAETNNQELLSQIDELMKQVAALKKNGPSNTIIKSCQAIVSPLNVGTTGEGVRKLQEFLTTTGHFTYPEITGYYGRETIKAVQAWQVQNSIVSGGTPELTGFGRVGLKTIQSMKAFCSQP